ncbi:regulatory protein RecX [uncultured Microbacterium sp.]|uniref:regulatory protein RecX n=1 Tax=uncultured Microbacterium sp. TaxID=191216 RepID=UPI0028D6C20A|nr:regulatory protein RecX [uncultured Microbacterium sp.]
MSAPEGDGGTSERLAPVTYLPGAAPAEEPVRWAVPLQSSFDAEGSPDGASQVDDEDDSSIDDAESALARRLRRSALSEREARTFLAQHGVEASVVEAVVDRFLSLGWLDDAVLAEQLLHAGTSRKGQGRRAIAQTLSQRGIGRDAADAALAALPDDDEDRALEYARSKAHGLRSYDIDTAMRRLMGQLARRGYGGAVASQAARTALNEQRGGGGVRFR